MRDSLRRALGICHSRWEPYRHYKTPGRAYNALRNAATNDDADAMRDFADLWNILRKFNDPYCMPMIYGGDILASHAAALLPWRMMRDIANAHLADYQSAARRRVRV